MNRAGKIALTPLSGLYGLVVDRRSALYERGVFRQHRVTAPVISVGNITVGGTGKTPLVEWIARTLAAEGHRPCVVTRGYHRNTKGRIVASNGIDISATLHEAGEEAFMLAEALKGKAAVVCDSDRVAGANWAIENLGSDVIVLDDGFQHRRIARDLDVVTIDATNPWGNGNLLPAGTLREPLAALSRADCFVITRADDAVRTAALRDELRELNAEAPIFTSVTNLSETRILSINVSAPLEPKSHPIAAFCAIGNPESFFALLKREGFQLKYQRPFGDHHRFNQTDLDKVEAAARNAGAEFLITTAKDAVKLLQLKFEMPCYVAEIAIEIVPSEEFRRLLTKTIESFK
ncbi:MAG TPA: tetraacyldisaccharide 4'-kinase [Pyrinomonadaceae bacterium]|nr:tetraacyldisaccharide 4'-kinase [Pyrinomonadaceae bacterium]